MPTTTFPPILIWQPGGGTPVGPVSNPPVYSQAGITALIQGQAYIDVVFGSIQTDTNWVLVECEVVNTADGTPLNLWPGIMTQKLTTGFRLYLNGLPDSANYYLHWAVSGINITPSLASTYQLTGPSSGPYDPIFIQHSSNFTVSLPPSTTVPGVVTITPNDGGAGGTFTPASVTVSTASASATFTYSPAAYGTVTIGTTNSSSLLSNPAALSFTAVAATYTLSGPSSGGIGSPSSNFTVALPVSGVVIGTVTVTPHDGGGGGAFSPTSVALTTGAPSATFTYTPGSTGAKTISVTNNGGLIDPASIVYTASAPFSPTDIAGLKLWLKADALALTDGAPVNTWPDSSGNGYDFPDAFSYGIYKTNIVNAKPVVRFDGIASSYKNSSAPIVPSGSTAYTMFSVIKAASVSAGSHCFVNASPFFRRDAADLNLYHYTGSGFANVVDTGGITAGTWYVVAGDWNGTNIRLWKNGTAKGTSGATLLPAAGNTSSVGYDWSSGGGVGGDYFDGDIAEVLIYNTSLSTTDRVNVENYLGAKYGITIVPTRRRIFERRDQAEQQPGGVS